MKINISDDTIVCFIDAYDVIFSSQNDDIFDKFINLNCNILFSAELFCYPENNAKYYNDLKLYNSNSNFKYLNSGGYIGYNKYIKKMLEWKSDDDIIDICKNCGDQNYFTLYFLENWNTENIKLDINQEIFQSMCGLNYYKDFIFINGKLYNKALKKYPSIIHFNGFGDMEIKKAKNILTGSNENIIKKFIDLMIESKINESIINIYYIYPFKVLNQITA